MSHYHIRFVFIALLVALNAVAFADPLPRGKAGAPKTPESVDEFFTAAHIGPWQYPVAETLCTFMIAQSKKGWVDFIKGIKDGIDPMECLTTKYKASRERLLPALGKQLGLKKLN